jgi:hypothetical protein
MELLFIGTGFLLPMTLGLALYAAPVLLLRHRRVGRGRGRAPSPAESAVEGTRIGLFPLKLLLILSLTCTLGCAFLVVWLFPRPYLVAVVLGLAFYLAVKRLLRLLGLGHGRRLSLSWPMLCAETDDVGPFLLKALLALAVGSVISLLAGILGVMVHTSREHWVYLAPGFAISQWADARWGRYVPIYYMWGGAGMGLNGVIYSVPVFIAEMIMLARRQRRLRR